LKHNLEAKTIGKSLLLALNNDETLSKLLFNRFKKERKKKKQLIINMAATWLCFTNWAISHVCKKVRNSFNLSVVSLNYLKKGFQAI